MDENHKQLEVAVCVIKREATKPNEPMDAQLPPHVKWFTSSLDLGPEESRNLLFFSQSLPSTIIETNDLPKTMLSKWVEFKNFSKHLESFPNRLQMI